MSLPPTPRSQGLRFYTTLPNPLASSNAAYEPLGSPTAGSRPRKHKEAIKKRAKAADHYLHSLPAYKKMKQMRLLARTISTILNIVMFAIMVFTITIFFSTRHDTALGRFIWPESPEVWPTWLLLGASGFSLVAAVGLLVFFCCCYERATHSWRLVLLITIVEIGFWITITTVYRKEKKKNDIWGWSCSAIAKDLQHGGGKVNFGQLCNLQSVTWFVSLGETILKVLILIVLLLLRRRLKKETHHQKSGLIEAGGTELVDTIQNFGF